MQRNDTTISQHASALCADEVVRYIAHRHHLSPESVISGFLPTGGSVAACLEDNERAIISELVKRSRHSGK